MGDFSDSYDPMRDPSSNTYKLHAENEWRRKFARVVYLGNNIAPLDMARRDELNALLSEAYTELKTFPNQAAPVPIEELIAKSSLGAPFAEPDEAELDIAVAELKRIEALPESVNCYCSEYQSSGLPCPPGKCPNVPKDTERPPEPTQVDQRIGPHSLAEVPVFINEALKVEREILVGALQRVANLSYCSSRPALLALAEALSAPKGDPR